MRFDREGIIKSMKTKAELRKEILRLRDDLTLKERQQKSKMIARKVFAHKAFLEADSVLLFASYRSEVDTKEIFVEALALGKKVFFPRVEGKVMNFYRVKTEEDLKEGYRSIREPEAVEEKRFQPDTQEKVLVLMPGAVFDEQGGRIGYGGGYYDKFLQWLESEIPVEKVYKLAVAFSCQIVGVGVIPREEHDVAVEDLIVEDTVTYR